MVCCRGFARAGRSPGKQGRQFYHAGGAIASQCVQHCGRHRALRHVEIDTNFWKTFVHERLATAMGDFGCLSIFGRKAVEHRLFAEHLTAEYRVRTEGRGRTVDEWKLPAHKPDNHWFDCVVGCAAAASMQGVERIGARSDVSTRRERIKLSDLQRQRMR